MKKIICLLLSFVLIVSSFSVFALSDNDNEELKNILSIVKGKIYVDNCFTEFNMSIRGNNSETQQRRYEYFWETKDRTKSLNVYSDKSGNILSYSFYDAQNDKSKGDISVKYETCLKVADDFIKKALPFCFEDCSDMLLLKSDAPKMGTLSGNKVYFNFTYQRIKDGYPVWGNDATVTVFVAGNEPVISNMNSSWDYESVFHKTDKILDNPIDSYLKVFPVEIVYKNKYVLYKSLSEDSSDTPLLIYRFRDNQTGYILADTGEKFEPKKNNILFNSAMKEEFAEDSATGGAMRGDLTPEEIARIEEVSSLISADKAEKILRDNKHLSIDDEYTRNGSSLYKTKPEGDDYTRTVTLSYSSGNKSSDIYASLDASTGEIMSYSRSVYGPDVWNKEYVATEEEKKTAYEKLQAFVNETAKSYIDHYRLKEDNSYDSSVSRTYERYIDGVRYIDNRININYDLKENYISGYNISYTKEFTDLPSVKDAIDINKATEIIFDLYPINLFYMKGEDGYHLCFGNDSLRNVEIYAISGEKVTSNTKTVNLKPYTDTHNHWVKDVSDKLLNIGIGFEDGLMKPDEKCSQKDFLRIMMCAVNKSANYLTYTDDYLYSRLEGRKHIQPKEKNPEGNVMREDAFVYTVRMMNHEEIARLKDVFKTDFLDNSHIDEEKIGYAAILKGFGLISGDGTYLRPKEDITRAEVMSMAYNCIVVR